uniref:Protein phosphatase 1 regulatory subunit 1B n=1 Tax=Oncorhynchus kisutch TaxID=8019 RepID=A0A8C7FS26_ONCKI
MDADAKDKERKTKIQFSVPSAVPLQLDPRQVEMIRRRRPTPATLFRLTDQPSPEEENDNHQWVIGENGVLTKNINAHVYQPPSLKAVQRMAQARMKSLGTCGPEETDDFSGEESVDCEESLDISPVSTTGERSTTWVLCPKSHAVCTCAPLPTLANFKALDWCKHGIEGVSTTSTPVLYF